MNTPQVRPFANAIPPVMSIVRLILVVLAFAGPVDASELTFETRTARFQLFNHCGPMGIVVEGLSAEANRIGLTEYSLRAAVESRLRAARLYDTNAMPWLYLQVSVMERACAVNLEFRKFVSDYASGESRAAKTWATGSVCTHGGDAGYIRSIVAGQMDKFILEYLRVNEADCSDN